MTLVAEPEVLVDQLPAFEPDPDREHPAARWARRHAKPLTIAGAAALILVTGLWVNELTKPTPVAPAAAPPTVTVRIDGDIAGTTGHARFASGGVTDLPAGGVSADMPTADRLQALAYVSTSPAGEQVTAVSVAIVAGKGEASCSISVGDKIVETKTASAGGMAMCFWAGDAGAPPPFRTN